MLADYVSLGLKNLRKRRLRSVLTMIGIFIGIATVVSLIALGQGLRDAVSSQFNLLGADRLIISAKGGGFGPPGQGVAAELTDDDLAVVRNSRYVELAAGRLIEPAQVEFNDKQRPHFVGSLPQEPDERRLVLGVVNADPAAGRWPKPEDGLRVMIGSDLSDPDLFGKPVQVGNSLLINGRRAEVVGVLEKTGSVQFDDSIFMNEDAMRDLFDIPDRQDAIVAEVVSVDQVDLAKETITKNLRSSRGVDERKEDFTVETSGELLASFDTILGGVTAFLVGIAGISIIVGGIGIMNTMYTAVLERRREIGIMKAVGGRNGDVLAIFLFESGLLGTLGGLIGVLLGWLLSLAVVVAGTAALGPGLLQANITPTLVFGSLLFSFAIGAIAGTLPAYEASKLPPVEALRQ